jgi:hypothetical protein
MVASLEMFYPASDGDNGAGEFMANDIVVSSNGLMATEYLHISLA